MPQFWKVITRAEAQGLFSDLPPLGTERVAIGKAIGRVLAEDVVSRFDVPHFRRSTMDGFAVLAEDTYKATEQAPVCLKLIGVVEMGRETNLEIDQGEAASISTGGMLPAGADAVVMIEQTEQPSNGSILVRKAAAPGQHIASIGEDIKQGEQILARGRRLRALDIGALAAMGRTEVSVRRQARIGILSTGDEIVPAEEHPGPGQIRGSNLFTLAALTEEWGGVPVDFGIIADDEELLRTKVLEMIGCCDLVVISGGSSVGAHDNTRHVLESLQPDGILAHGVAMRPGKPTILALVRSVPVIGLPGHPVSSAIVFRVLVRPIIWRLMDVEPGLEELITIPARLSQNISSVSGREDYLQVSLRREENQWWAEPVRGKSGTISTLVKADGMVRISLESEGLERGAGVEVNLF